MRVDNNGQLSRLRNELVESQVVQLVVGGTGAICRRRRLLIKCVINLSCDIFPGSLHHSFREGLRSALITPRSAGGVLLAGHHLMG